MGLDRRIFQRRFDHLPHGIHNLLRRCRQLAQLGLTVLALVAWLTLVQVFPFDFGGSGANELAHLAGLLVIMALAIAILVQAIVWSVDQTRRALR